jgi:hypothetical protein
MKNQKISPELRRFIKKIISVEIGLVVLAGAIALFSNQPFGLMLFGLGILASIVGGYLGNAYPYNLENPAMSDSNPYERPVEKTRVRALYFVKHSVPFYAFENAILFAGIIAVFVGLLILFL